MQPLCLLNIVISLLGIFFGRFLNVYLSWKLPTESFVLRPDCFCCKHEILKQYPVIEFFNGLLYLVVIQVNGWYFISLVYCFLASALIVISIMDYYTYVIPYELNIIVMVLGVIHLFLDNIHWKTYVMGFFVVSVFLYLIYVITKGTGIGGGDIKLMAVSGLLLGWDKIIVAFFAGCIIGVLVHLLRMVVSRVNNRFALGPYLSGGIFIAALWGKEIIAWYLT
jgi:leader peptidase (prepilin peptidase)/N-methyltransferase